MNAERKLPEYWLLRFDDDTFTGWMYNPEEDQPPKRLRLLERATAPFEKISNDELETLDVRGWQKSGFLGDLLAWAAIIVVGTAIILYVTS